jgi:hypothetical protein
MPPWHADGGVVVIRRRPVAVYRVIDEDELLLGDGASAWPAASSRQRSLAADSPAPHLVRRGGWQRLAVLGLLLVAAAGGALVVAAGPRRAAAVSPATAAGELRRGPDAPRATELRAPTRLAMVRRPRPAHVRAASVPRATVLAAPVSVRRAVLHTPPLDGRRHAVRRVRPRPAGRARPSARAGARTSRLAEAGAIATTPRVSSALPPPVASSALPPPRAEVGTRSPQENIAVAAPSAPADAWTPSPAPRAGPPRNPSRTAGPAEEFGFER